jgi:DNA polymerase-3 subunit delta'
MKFAEIPGEKALIASLIQAARSGQVAHAQLFAGPEGGVALMIALAFAQYLNCESPTETDSCGVCQSCSMTSKFIHPDLHFCFPWAKSKALGEKADDIKAFLPLFRNFISDRPYGTIADWAESAEFENRTPIINIKTVRDMMMDLQLKAYLGKYKIQIIWLPETMRTEGSNAFLKILEEPPPYTLFFLVSQDTELLLPTLISRTQRVTVPNLDDSDLAAYLNEKFEVEETKAHAIAALSEGNLAEARSFLDQKENDYHKLFLEWQRACYGYDFLKILAHTDEFVELGKELQKGFLRFSLGRIRHALALANGAEVSVHLPESERTDLQKLGKILPLSLVETELAEMEKAFFHIDRNASGRMVFLDLSLILASGFSEARMSKQAKA